MTTLPSLAAFSVLYGLGSGCLMPLGTACISQLSPDMRHTGLRQGVVLCLCSIGVLAAGPVTGLLYQDFKSSHAMQWFTGGMTMLGGLMLLMIRVWARQAVWTVF